MIEARRPPGAHQTGSRAQPLLYALVKRHVSRAAIASRPTYSRAPVQCSSREHDLNLGALAVFSPWGSGPVGLKLPSVRIAPGVPLESIGSACRSIAH
jgi:hypothetical protein